MIGRYIDAISEAARDRIITAQDWCTGTTVDEEGARCLHGHASMCVSATDLGDKDIIRIASSFLREVSGEYVGVGSRFDALVDKHGMKKIVALCKARAAKGNALALSTTPTREEAMR